MQANISRLGLCVVWIALKLRRFRIYWLEIQCELHHISHNYLTSISQALASSHKLVFIGLNYRCELHLKLKELLYSKKYLHWIRVLHSQRIVFRTVSYCCLLLAASMETTIEQYRSRISCHNNFVKANDAFSLVRGWFWNMILMMFYLNVFYLPTLKQVVGRYKSWNEVMFWFTPMRCYNVYIPLLIRQANDVEENPGPIIFWYHWSNSHCVTKIKTIIFFCIIIKN